MRRVSKQRRFRAGVVALVAESLRSHHRLGDRLGCANDLRGPVVPGYVLIDRGANDESECSLLLEPLII